MKANPLRIKRGLKRGASRRANPNAYGIESSNSSGQGRHAGHAGHPFHLPLGQAGWLYSHTTPVHHGDDVRLRHTYEAKLPGAPRVSVYQKRDGTWTWESSMPGSGTSYHGADIRKYLRGVVSRLGRSRKRNPASASDYRVTVKYPSGQARTYTSVHRMFGGARPSEIAGDEARKAPNGTIVEVRESNVGRPGGLVYRYQVVGYGAVQSMKEKSAGGRSAKRNPNLEDFADVNAYLAAVKGEQARATRLIRLKWTRDEVGGVGRWTAKTGGVTVHVYEPAKHFAGLYQVYVGRQHYSNEDSLAAAKDKAREAVGYYLGVSSNMMGRMASESERARAQRENPAKRARGARANPAVSADKVIRAFLDGKEATSKQLTSSGVRLDGNWTGGRGLASWQDGKIKLGYPYGNVTQSWLKKVARMAPAYLLTDDSRWALPGKTVKLLKREGR